MADERDDTERTEDPTPKRLDEAIKRGDVVKSQEVNTWFVIAGGTLVLMVFAAPMAASLETTLRGLLANSYADSRRRPGAGRSGASELAMTCSAALGIPLPAARACGARRQHRSSTGSCSRSSRSSRSCRKFRRPPA